MAIHVDRRVDLGHDRVGLRGKAAAPHLIAHGPPGCIWTMTTSPDVMQNRPRRRLILGTALALVVLAGLAAVYGIDALGRNPAGGACQAATVTAQRMAPLSHGEVAAVAVSGSP